MKIISWNVNGIRAVLKKGFVDFVSHEDPDVLCLQEVKAEEHQVEHDIKGYHIYWNHAEKKGYSGTAVFSKEKPISVQNGIGSAEHDTEGRVITLEFDDFYLINVYTPNSGNGLVRLPYRGKWDAAFRAYAHRLDAKKPVIICGDLNVAHQAIDLARPKENYDKSAGYTQQEIDGLDGHLSAGFVDSFRHFTKEGGHYSYFSYRFDARGKNVGWRLDYFLVAEILMEKVKSSEILRDVLGSDHVPVRLNIVD